MQTQLIEFSSRHNDILRGIYTTPDNAPKAHVLCLHGFEHHASAEKKFKSTADEFMKKNIATFRFDFSGNGISDGEFRTMTISKLAQECEDALCYLQQYVNATIIHIIAHSMGAAVLAHALERIQAIVGKVILLAPALNQRDLLRYYFVRSQDKRQDITWNNYKEFLDENAFQQDTNTEIRMTKSNYLDASYFHEAKDIDYSNAFVLMQEQVLHVHGTKDFSVPFESVNYQYQNLCIVENGDHALERPDMFEKWHSKAISFFC